MKILLDNDLNELQQLMLDLNEPKFRAKQLYDSLLLGQNVDENTTLPKPLKEKLSDYIWQPIKIYKTYEGKDAVKFLYKLNDNNIIEGIVMFHKYGNTLCVSTQVGCRMGCKFCASTLDGLLRNLTCGEILGQVVAVNKYLGGNIADRKITNIVLMGSGEPLDNYDNVLKFLKMVTDKNSFNFSKRNISLSTCGLADKIDKLADDFAGIVLTISLHSSTQSKRQEIMPIAYKYDLTTLINSVKNYAIKSGRRVVFEYTLIDGVNDSIEDAKNLSKLTKGLMCHINLIPLNFVKERNLQTSKNIYNFEKQLKNMGCSVTVRNSMGSEIDGACGQLRRKHLAEENNE